MPSTNNNYTKVLTMLEKVDEIVWIEKRLDFTQTVYCSIGNTTLRNRQNIVNNIIFAPGNIS